MAATRGALLAYVDLVQDIDVLLPVLIAVRDQTRWPMVIRVARWLAAASPRAETLLTEHRLPFRYVRRSRVIAGVAPSLSGIAAVLTASESTAEAHAAGHALARRAEGRGISGFTLQHGLETDGLGRDDGARFASATILVWFAPDRMPDGIAPETRAKLAHVGRPEPARLRQIAVPRIDVGVFENLHWNRYSDADRHAFVAGLSGLAQARPDLAIHARAHPAGGWLDRHATDFRSYPNIDLTLSSSARASEDGAEALISRCVRVITTPSTIALDAAQAGRPTALAVDGGSAYAPLRVLCGPADWIAFCDDGDARAAMTFASGATMPGDATARVLDRLAMAMTP